jgi:hypothetical protein
MTRSRILLGSLILAATSLAACDLNPQPLPPGEQPDSSLAEAPPGNGSGGGQTSSDGGGAPVLSPGDASPIAPDAAAQDASEGAADGSIDSPSDGPSDGALDAALDASDTSD